MRRVQNNFYWGLGGNLIIVAIIMALHLLHIPINLNNAISDILSRSAPAALSPEKRSLVIECLPDQIDHPSALWLDFITTLENNGAEQIVFLFFPPAVGKLFYEKVVKNENVFFGRETLLAQAPSPILSDQSLVSPLHAAVESSPQVIPPPQNGVYRQQYATIPVLPEDNESKPLPHLVRKLVEQRTGSSYLGEDLYLVNFNGRSLHSQPIISLQQALNGNIIPTLVKGRTVFIGLKLTTPYTGLLTPLAENSELLSPTVFTAYSFDTLLYGKEIHRADLFIIVTLLLASIFSLSILSQFLKAGLAIFMGIMGCFLTGAFTWSFLAFMQMQIPLIELLTGQVFALLLVIAGKSLLSEDKIHSVAFEAKMELQERLMPASIYDSPQYWMYIVGMVSQILNLDRSIFLEKIPGDHRVQEVAAANTSIDDIQERRRDFERTPYLTALEKDETIEVKKFLSPRDYEEQQFLTPLRIGEGDILGFWACSIISTQEHSLKDLQELRSHIDTFADQISEMLYARRQWQLEQKQLQSPLRKLLSLEAGEGRLDEINQAFSLLIKRLNIVETVFDSLGSGAILYDLFGQVVYANQKVTSLCRNLEISPYKYSGAELIVLLTGRSLDETRKILTDLIFSGEKVNFPTQKKGKLQVSYMLTVTTVKTESFTPGNERGEPLSPAFNIMGFLFEINEMTNVESLLRAKDVFFTLSNRSFHNYKISFPPVLDRLQDEKTSASTRAKLLHFMEQRLSSLFDYIDRLSDMMTQNLLSADTPSFPTDYKDCIRLARSRLEEKAQAKKVTFDFRLPHSQVLVMAVPEELTTVFQHILHYLLEDAEPDSALEVRISRDQHYLSCSLSNRGYGMPDHDFQKYLNDEETVLSQGFKALYNAQERIRQFGGEFSAKSELGKGSSITLKMKRFT